MPLGLRDSATDWYFFGREWEEDCPHPSAGILIPMHLLVKAKTIRISDVN